MPANRVLLVENDADTREVTALLLNHAGYEVVVAPDLAAGIAFSSGKPGIDVVVTDMYLGNGETGTALIRSLRENNLHLPVVLTSADEQVSVVARLLNVMFLPKPYGRQALLTVVAMARVCGA